MNKILEPLFKVVRFHKLKVLVVLIVTLLFTLALFPSSDLGDWVSSLVAKNANIYLQMNKSGLGINLLPPGIEAHEVVLEIPGLPPLKIGDLEASLLVSRLFTGKLGASAQVQRIFKGDVNLSAAQGARASSGQRLAEFAMSTEHLNLDELSEFLRAAGLLGMKLHGNLKLDSTAIIDPGLSDQPKASAKLDATAFSIPSQTIMVNMNGVLVPQQIPTFEIGKISLKSARLEGGVFDIQDLTLGDAKSEISGKIKGTLGLQMRKAFGGVAPEVNQVDLNMDLLLDKGFMDRNQKSIIGGFLILIPDVCKQITPKGTRLAFRMKIGRMGEPPNFLPLTEKL